MADKEDGPPHLENPNSPSYVCVECHNKDSLCLECTEMAQLPPNPTRNGRKGKDASPDPTDGLAPPNSTDGLDAPPNPADGINGDASTRFRAVEGD